MPFWWEGMAPFHYGSWGSIPTPKIKADLDWELLGGTWAGPQWNCWGLARQVCRNLVFARWSPQSHSDLSFAVDLLCGLKPIASLWTSILSPTTGWRDDLSQLQDGDCSFPSHGRCSSPVRPVCSPVPFTSQDHPTPPLLLVFSIWGTKRLNDLRQDTSAKYE